MSTFELLRTHPIPTLQVTLEEYREPSTGARHIHLAGAQADLAFLVAFPTVADSGGCHPSPSVRPTPGRAEPMGCVMSTNANWKRSSS